MNDFKHFQGFYLKAKGQNLALTVCKVLCLLDRCWGDKMSERERERARARERERERKKERDKERERERKREREILRKR